MRSSIARLAIAGGVLVLASLALSADGQGTYLTGEQAWQLKRSDTVTAELERREARLMSEIESGHAPEWAGKYYRGDGLGVNVSVTVAPGGFIYTWSGCLGRYDANYGGLEAGDGIIALDFELPNSAGERPGIAPSFLPVHWGDRLYLLAVDQVTEFANAVNSGREPCNRFCAEFLLREGDELIDVTGRPTLPTSWARYLLARPIEAAYLQTLESEVTPDPDAPAYEPWAWRKTTIRIAAGRNQGVWQGMAFYDSAPEASGIEYTVVTVGTDASTAVSTELVTGPNEAEPVKMPTTLSTRMYRPNTPVMRSRG